METNSFYNEKKNKILPREMRKSDMRIIDHIVKANKTWDNRSNDGDPSAAAVHRWRSWRCPWRAVVFVRPPSPIFVLLYYNLKNRWHMKNEKIANIIISGGKGEEAIESKKIPEFRIREAEWAELFALKTNKKIGHLKNYINIH